MAAAGLEGSQRSMMLGLMLLGTCGLVAFEYVTLMRSGGRQSTERWGGTVAASPLDDLFDRGAVAAPASAVAHVATVVAQAHRAGPPAAPATTITTDARPGPDAEVWMAIDEIDALPASTPTPRQRGVNKGSMDDRFGPGPLSTLSK